MITLCMRRPISKTNFWIGWIAALLVLSGCFPNYTWPGAIATHEVAATNSLGLLWERSEVIVRYTWSSSPLVAASSGRVFFLGRIGRDGKDGIYALSAEDGQLLWQREAISLWNLAATQDGLYVGDSGITARISRHDLETGELEWRRYFLGNSVLSLIVEDDLVSTYFNPDLYRVLSGEDGRVIRRQKSETPIYLSTKKETYLRPYLNVLRAKKAGTRKVIWETEIYGDILQPPIFARDQIFIRTGQGELYAIDRISGEIQWGMEEVFVSNIAVGQDAVYGVIKEGRLIGLDKQTGELIAFVEFSPAPFVVGGGSRVDGYYIAFDPETNVVFAFLGDSQQLFAFRTEEQ